MKTLKKVMAMTLAFATAMTMFVSASAFTDDADIKHEEAVGALSSLGIIKGNTDGSFAPKKTVTRGEMAKMIYVLRTGNDDGAAAYAGLTTTFTDIANTWAQPYIKYCYSLGIINGRSATKFDPDATVTGAEAAKMLLVTMGYDPAKAGLTGSTWALQTAALGSEKGLFEDVYQDLYEALNRENAAQEIYNTLDAKTVRFDGDDNAYTDQNRDGSDMKTVGEKFLDLTTVLGELKVSGNIGLATTGDDDKLIIGNVAELSDSVKNDLDFSDVTTDYTSLLGQTVKVMYKETKSSTGKKTKKVYGVYASDETQVAVKAKASDIEGVAGEQKIKIDGKKYDLDKNAKVYVTDATATGAAKLAEQKIKADGTISATADDNNKSIGELTYGAKSATDALYTYVDKTLSESDFEVTAISNNDDDDIDLIIVNAKTPAKLTTVNKDNVTYKTLVGGKTSSKSVELDLEDDTPEIYKDYKKDDYVFVDVDLFKDITVITKADSVKGKVAANKDGEAKINDVWYDVTNAGYTGNTTLGLNKDATLYVYGTYAYYVDGTSATDLDTLVVKSVGDYKSLDKGVETKVIFEDGTEKIINVEAVGTKIGDERTDNNALKSNDDKSKIKADTLYTYEEDDGDYTLVELQSSAVPTADQSSMSIGSVASAADNKVYDSDIEAIDGTAISDDAVVYIKYKSAGDFKYKAISGKELQGYKTIDGAATYVYNKTDKEITYALLLTDTNATSDNTLYGVVTSAYTQKNADGDKVTYVDILTADGEKTGVETDKNITLVKGDIVTFDGSYTNADNIAKAAGKYGAISKYNESTGLVSFESGLKYKGADAQTASAKIVKDTKVIYIDQKNDTWKATTGTPAEASELSGSTGYYANAYAIVNSDKEFDLLVYEVNDKIKDDSKTAIELTKTK